KRALYIANGSYSYDLWSKLDKGAITPREAQLQGLKQSARCIAINQRWIAHIDHRLGYEKAMLDEQGASELIAPKPKAKSAAASLPLCNYRAPNGLDIENIYNRG